MSEQLKYCMGCMGSIPYEAVICPECGYNEETVQPAPYLATGSIIMRKYLVGKVIGQTSDTVTYIGANVETGETVTVHEFFPANIVTREEGQTELTVKLGYDSMFSNCLQSYLTLWRGLDVFKDAVCLPNVLDIFDFNGTVYSVCAYKDFIPLSQYFKNIGEPLTWARAFTAFKPIMYALKKLNYSGIIHGNLNPETIFVGADGKLHIAGFSIPQCYSGVAELKTIPADGFAPVEIYEPTGAGAATDIYSITALLYYAITLQTPPDALSRVVNDTASLPASVASSLSPSVIEGLIHGLSVHPENRYSNFDDLLKALTPEVVVEKSTDKKVDYIEKLTQKEKIDRQIEREERKKEARKQEKRAAASAVSLGIKAFLSGFLVCLIAFCTFYATVLYKEHPIDFLDKILEPIAFLPLNKEEETTVPSPVAPVPTEPNYVTVADFVTYHTYDSILSNSHFNDNYKFEFRFEESMTVPKNGIISQSVPAGESVLAGVEITLVVSTGTTKIKLPDVTGLNYVKAADTLKSVGFKVKYDILTNNGKNTVGEVFSMDKEVGALYEKDTVVILKVWGKVATTTTTTAASSESTTAASGSQSTTKPTTEKPATTKPSTTKPATTAAD